MLYNIKFNNKLLVKDMGGNKSKNVVYTVGVPDSDEIEFSAVLRNPDSQQRVIAPTVWSCNSYYPLFQ